MDYRISIDSFLRSETVVLLPGRLTGARSSVDIGQSTLNEMTAEDTMMNERDNIMQQIVKLSTSMARRKPLALKSTDPAYRAMVMKSLELDEQRLENLYTRLLDV